MSGATLIIRIINKGGVYSLAGNWWWQAFWFFSFALRELAELNLKVLLWRFLGLNQRVESPSLVYLRLHNVIRELPFANLVRHVGRDQSASTNR